MPGLAVEPRQAVMAVGAGLLAIVAADAQLLVDQQHVGRLADAVLDQEAGDRRNTCRRRRRSCPSCASMKPFSCWRAAMSCFEPCRAARACASSSAGSASPSSLIDFRLDRRADRRGAAAAVDQRHLADIGAGRKVGEEDRLAADGLLDHHRALADDEDVVALLALVDDRLAGLDLLDLGGLEHVGEVVRGEARAEHLQQLPLGRDAGDRALRAPGRPPSA